MTKAANPIERYGVTRRWSDAVVHKDTVYFVEVPHDSSLDPKSQFRMVMKQIDERLAQVGSDRTRLLQVMIYLPNPADLSDFNELWDNWIPNGHAPSRACVHTQLAATGYCVELVVTAAIG